MLEKHKESLHKCSKCGICQSVCPIYKETGNECSVSRGQFIMLDGVVKNKLKLSKNINKYLDLCLKCNKCSEFCPSDIDVVSILLAAKYDYSKKSLSGKLYRFLESKYIFNLVLNFIKFFSKIFVKKLKSKSFDTKVVYFGGCLSALNPKVNNYIVKLLNKINIEVLDIDFNCCGMPFLTTGNIDRFVDQIKENLNKIPNGIDYIVTDCASCEWAWKQYRNYIEDKEILKKFDNIKFKNLYELISENNISFKLKKHKKVTYHKPCHENHSEVIVNIIKNISNIEYVELNDYDDCCGFGAFEQPISLKRSYPVIKKKKENIRNTGADKVITSCAGCLISLTVINTLKEKPQRLIEFLSKETDFSLLK